MFETMTMEIEQLLAKVGTLLLHYAVLDIYVWVVGCDILHFTLYTYSDISDRNTPMPENCCDVKTKQKKKTYLVFVIACVTQLKKLIVWKKMGSLSHSGQKKTLRSPEMVVCLLLFCEV